MPNQLPSESDLLGLFAKWRTVERFIGAHDPDQRWSRQLQQIKQGSMAVHSGARFYLEKAILAELLEDERWQRLADHPTQFDKDLEHLLKRIREYMRLRYGIEAHRPTQNESRDAKIYVLHREHSLSFTQVGRKLGISRGAAQRAYERYEERQSRAIQCLKELGECTRKWSIPLYVAAREASQGRQPSESSDPPPRAT